MITNEFLLTSLIVVLLPGTGVIYTVSNGLFLGTRAGIAAAAGCTAGIIPHLAASIFGLSAILHMSALVFQGMKYAGACYLLYLAWVMWRENGALNFSVSGKETNVVKIARRGFLINILNPKLSIFFLAFLPLFITPQAGSPLLQLTLLSGVFMALTFAVFVLYGIAANTVRGYVAGSPGGVQYVQRSFAAIFAALGIKLALSER